MVTAKPRKGQLQEFLVRSKILALRVQTFGREKLQSWEYAAFRLHSTLGHWKLTEMSFVVPGFPPLDRRHIRSEICGNLKVDGDVDNEVVQEPVAIGFAKYLVHGSIVNVGDTGLEEETQSISKEKTADGVDEGELASRVKSKDCPRTPAEGPKTSSTGTAGTSSSSLATKPSVLFP